MKLLLLFIGLTVVAAAPATDTKLGRCSLKKFIGLQQQCLRKFVMAFRRNPRADCNKHYDRSLACTRKWTRFCMQGVVPLSELKAVENSITRGNSSMLMRELYCGNKEINLPFPNEDDESCDKEFFPIMIDYVKRFFNSFRHKRSDPKLCGEYDFMLRSLMKLVKTHCNRPDSKQTLWILGSKYNPFCSEGQKP